MTRIVAAVLVGFFAGWTTMVGPKPAGTENKEPPLRLGNFSVSLLVKDLAASRAFYEKLGFKTLAKFSNKKMAILQNETATIGLFQGAIQKNSLTFNPGWDRDSKTLADFDDVRALQKELIARGLSLTTETDANATGPAFITLTDPDGNPIVIDQHVPKPKS